MPTSIENRDITPDLLQRGTCADWLMTYARPAVLELRGTPDNVRRAITSDKRKTAKASGEFVEGNRRYEVSYTRKRLTLAENEFGVKEELNLHRTELGETEKIQAFTIEVEDTEKRRIGSTIYMYECGGMSIIGDDQKTKQAINTFLKHL